MWGGVIILAALFVMWIITKWLLWKNEANRDEGDDD